jgi:hypothetical protein
MAVIHDPDIRNKIADLHAAGQGRNAIARTLGLADNAVSDTAADLGLTFDSVNGFMNIRSRHCST